MNKVLFAILFFYILTGCQSHEKKGIEGNNNDGNTVTIGDNNVIISDGKTRLVDSVDIIGGWNKEIARKIVLDILNQSIDSIRYNYLHQVLDFYSMDYVDKESIIAVAYSREKDLVDINGEATVSNSCHACGVEMSFIEFDKFNNGWKIENQYVRKLKTGSWGEPSTDWRLINMGYHKFGFVEKGGFTGQGYTESYTAIHTWVTGEFREILSFASGYDDSGAKDISEDNFESTINVIKEGTSFYDLLITSKGIKKSKPFEEKNYYKFDGLHYSVSNDLK
jgi:hypothetical protein